MTTEVLRNQVYSNSPELDSLSLVVMDEIHFLGDKSRGSVWEEVLIGLPRSVHIVGLSATVSNIEDFASWLAKVRGGCEVVLTDYRPVPLDMKVIVGGDRNKSGNTANLHEIFDDNSHKLNKTLAHIMRQEPGFRALRRNERHKARGGHRRSGGRSYPNQNKDRGLRFTPKVEAVISTLHANNMLPAIYFVFSRAKCEELLLYSVRSDLQLVTNTERDEIKYHIDNYFTQHQTFNIFQKFGYHDLYQGLLSGVAYHHAGMIPVLKELVEYLFNKGLVKCVFATETLALGINMPARSVVINSLIKFDGVSHSKITPGLFTQLTGRAGRRGLDTIGYAVIVDEMKFGLEEVAGLVQNRIYPYNQRLCLIIICAQTLLICL